MKKALQLSAWITALAVTASIVPLGALAAPAAAETELTNTIAEGEYGQDKTMWYASFNDLEPGEDYIVIVSRSGDTPLAADNLVYLQEAAATETGSLTVPFRAAAQEIGYAVACRPGKVLENPHHYRIRRNGRAESSR